MRKETESWKWEELSLQVQGAILDEEPEDADTACEAAISKVPDDVAKFGLYAMTDILQHWANWWKQLASEISPFVVKDKFYHMSATAVQQP